MFRERLGTPGLDPNLVFLLHNFTKGVCVLITSIKVSKNNVNLESAFNELLERLCISLSSRSVFLKLFYSIAPFSLSTRRFRPLSLIKQT